MKATVLTESSIYFIFLHGFLRSSDVYGHESGRCHSLRFFLTFYLSRFSFYINNGPWNCFPVIFQTDFWTYQRQEPTTGFRAYERAKGHFLCPFYCHRFLCVLALTPVQLQCASSLTKKSWHSQTTFVLVSLASRALRPFTWHTGTSLI